MFENTAVILSFVRLFYYFYFEVHFLEQNISNSQTIILLVMLYFGYHKFIFHRTLFLEWCKGVYDGYESWLRAKMNGLGHGDWEVDQIDVCLFCTYLYSGSSNNKMMNKNA